MRKLLVPVSIAAAAVAMVAGLASTPAVAGGGTFAQFFQTTSSQPFVFTNISAGVGGLLKTNPVAVTFTFLKPTSFGAAGTPINATLTLIGGTSGSAVSGGGITDQGMGLVSMIFQTTGAHPVNLLTVTSTSSSLFGITGGNTGALTSDTKAGATIIYSSSVLALKSGGNKDFTLGFSSLQPTFMKAGDGILQSFKASGTGTFAAPVPEASTMVSFGVLMLGGGLLVFARRKRTADKVA